VWFPFTDWDEARGKGQDGAGGEARDTMKQRLVILGIVVLLLGIGGVMFSRFRKQAPAPREPQGGSVKLPTPVFDSEVSIEEALLKRRSVREYQAEALALGEVSQLLWAAQGITKPPRYRTAPSAGALYPLEVYVMAGEVVDLADGVYRYQPEGHSLDLIREGDWRSALRSAALDQEFIEEAPLVILIAAVYERTTGKYGDRGIPYVHMEVGTAAQNIYLQSVSLDLGTVFVGAFYDEEVKQIMGLKSEEVPLCLMPVGRK
jgi:SagB-type dehydrogenase family enzyme